MASRDVLYRRYFVVSNLVSGSLDCCCCSYRGAPIRDIVVTIGTICDIAGLIGAGFSLDLGFLLRAHLIRLSFLCSFHGDSLLAKSADGDKLSVWTRSVPSPDYGLDKRCEWPLCISIDRFCSAPQAGQIRQGSLSDALQLSILLVICIPYNKQNRK